MGPAINWKKMVPIFLESMATTAVPVAISFRFNKVETILRFSMMKVPEAKNLVRTVAMESTRKSLERKLIRYSVPDKNRMARSSCLFVKWSMKRCEKAIAMTSANRATVRVVLTSATGAPVSVKSNGR